MCLQTINFLHCPTGLSVTLATLHTQKGEEPSPGRMQVAGTPGSAPSPQSESVTNELQELSLQPAPNLLPLQERKNGEAVSHLAKMFIMKHSPSSSGMNCNVQ